MTSQQRAKNDKFCFFQKFKRLLLIAVAFMNVETLWASYVNAKLSSIKNSLSEISLWRHNSAPKMTNFAFFQKFKRFLLIAVAFMNIETLWASYISAKLSSIKNSLSEISLWRHNSAPKKAYLSFFLKSQVFKYIKHIVQV